MYPQTQFDVPFAQSPSWHLTRGQVWLRRGHGGKRHQPKYFISPNFTETYGLYKNTVLCRCQSPGKDLCTGAALNVSFICFMVNVSPSND